MRFAQNVTYMGISIVIILVMLAIRPQHSISATGIYLPQTPSLPATTDLTLYQHNPGSNKILGIIYAQYHSEADDKHAPEILTKFAKEQANTHGANGLIINFIGHNENKNYPDLSGYEIIATAITKVS